MRVNKAQRKGGCRKTPREYVGYANMRTPPSRPRSCQTGLKHLQASQEAMLRGVFRITDFRDTKGQCRF